MLNNKLRNDLRRRGVKLNEGLNMLSPSDLFKATGISMADEIFQSYRLFDGFCEQDEKSYLEMWSVKRLVEIKKVGLGMAMPAGYTAIGDILMDSEFLICDMENPMKPVMLLYEERNVGEYYSDFWERFLQGEFDK